LDATPDAINVFDLVRLRCTFGARELPKMLGYTSEQIEEMGAGMLQTLLHPDDSARVLERLKQFETASDEDVIETDFRMKRALGEWRRMHSRAVVYERAKDGRPTKVLAVIKDVTLSKVAEVALSQSELFYRELIEFLPVGIAATDDRGRVTFASSACRELFGVNTDAAVAGTRIRDWVAPENIPDKAARRRMRRSILEPEEFRLLRKDGTLFWAEVSSVPLFDAHGRLRGNFVTIHDATERRQAQEDLRKTSERLQLLSRRIVKVQEDERRHLARELHDEVGQALTAILYRLEALKTLPPGSLGAVLDQAIEITDRTIQSVRDLSLDLRPALLDEVGLAETLRWYVDRQVRSANLEVGLSVSPDAARLPPDVRTACFRVAQEALTNVVRHANARHAGVQLRVSGDSVELVVRDDGSGFDVAGAGRRARMGNNVGILGMQERAELLGGETVFESSPGGGTIVRARFPISGEHDGRGSP